jgi:hypothetical protein
LKENRKHQPEAWGAKHSTDARTSRNSGQSELLDASRRDFLTNKKMI